MSTFIRANVTRPSQCVVERCDRCGGSGVFHIFGTCFRCGGNGKDPTYRGWGFPKDWTDEQCQQFLDAREQRLAKARDARAAKKTAKELAIYNANREAYPVLDQFNDTSGSGWPIRREGLSERLSPVVQDILSKAIRFRLSTNQAGVLEKALADIAAKAARKAAEQAAAVTPPAGRLAVEGVMVWLKIGPWSE
jgi:RecJ-like exonuclease